MAEAIAKNIPGKRWTRIIPPCILVYIFGFMDRTNIGFAMAGGMSEELQMTATLSGLAAGFSSLVIWFCRFRVVHWQKKATLRSLLPVLFWHGVSCVCC